jgi:glycosyltransferase involved in cell wall biosynthesis
LISSGGYYGAENLVVGLLASLRRLGCHPILGVFRNSENPHTEVEEAARKEGLQTFLIPCQGRWDQTAVRRTAQHIRQHKADIVHCHGYKADLYGYAATRGYGWPLIATCHNWTRESRAVRLYEWIDRFALRRFHHVLAVSDNVRDRLERSGMPAHRVTVIGNGLDLQRLKTAAPTLRSELPAGSRIIGSVGRLVPPKGFDVLLRAMPAVLRRVPDAFLVIAGEGPDRQRLEGLIQELSLEDHARLLGTREDIPGVYRSLDLFVLPSFNEGMPMVVMEAMAAGLPVVATAVGAVPALISQSGAGLVEPGDCAGLTEAIVTILTDPGLGGRVGAKLEERARAAFSIDEVARKYLQVYDSVPFG